MNDNEIESCNNKCGALCDIITKLRYSDQQILQCIYEGCNFEIITYPTMLGFRLAKAHSSPEFFSSTEEVLSYLLSCDYLQFEDVLRLTKVAKNV